MASHNPNEPSAYTITGTGVLEGMSWGSHSGWNLPATIETPYGTATLWNAKATRPSNSQYVTSAMVIVVRGNGQCYHSQDCRYAVEAVRRGRAMLVNLEIARGAGYRPCSTCTPHQSVVVAVIVKTASQPKQASSSYNRRLMAIADSGYNGS
jgi:hypothetical protein